MAAGVDLFDDVDPLMAEAFTEQAAGTPLLPALRAARRTTFDRLSVEKSWSTASPVAATS